MLKCPEGPGGREGLKYPQQEGREGSQPRCSPPRASVGAVPRAAAGSLGSWLPAGRGGCGHSWESPDSFPVASGPMELAGMPRHPPPPESRAGHTRELGDAGDGPYLGKTSPSRAGDSE